MSFIDGYLTLDGNQKVKTEAFCVWREGRESVVLVALADEKTFEQEKFYIHSMFDSFVFHRDNYLKEGLYTTLLNQGDTYNIKKKIKFGNDAFSIPFNYRDAFLMRKVVARETHIIYQYKSLDVDAMLRFYRMIFRTSYPYLKDLAMEIKNKYPNKTKKQLFDYVYSAVYKMEAETLEGSKIIQTPIDCLVGQKGDCDSKSILLHGLVSHLNIESEILLSFAYRHAALGVPNELVKASAYEIF